MSERGGVLVKSPYGEWRVHISTPPRPLMCRELLQLAIGQFAQRGLNRSLEWRLLLHTEEGTVAPCMPGDVVEPCGTYTLATTFERATGQETT